MKTQTFVSATLISLSLATPLVAYAQTDTQKLDQQSRVLAKEFLGKLKPELMHAMKNGGPVHALSFCKTKAPEIAANLSKSSGWHVNRVSLKPRGASATPDKWEVAVLNDFEAQKMAGIPVKQMEYSEVIKVDGKPTYRYMKPIPTGAVCLSCHGTHIAPAVKQKLNELYPHDKAVGFNKGDIRGAFSFSKTL
ncbi:DUF3365 domain-containing protein [Hydrogenovibrio sp. JE_KL2]|uniref:Tll0287-like domain-containing protein n=1 Tax=Hydrogenovibrio sp. JE_KL2 TaxID=2651188 RepID=UPI00128B3BCD|nr:DUF3365 domain-containing protein [Hydrogenovibrio sp. JE_KL2]MBN2607388.1 DUF3365 domain-containing protein [Thiotrichales bacterium]MPQ77372.1 DUF3365 domain-containing protein [Hydrogenovibrio sp. JE_KL2]